MTLPLSFNQRVSNDLKGIIAFYEQESGVHLAEEFQADSILCLDQILRNPTQSHFFVNDLRRANLKRFPYHFLYRIKSTSVRILVIRHNHRHPDFGINRQ